MASWAGTSAKRADCISRGATRFCKLARHFPGWAVRGTAAGLHLVAEPPADVDIRLVVKRAATRSVRLHPLSDYARNDRGRRGLVFGYASLSEREINEGIRRMLLQRRDPEECVAGPARAVVDEMKGEA